MKGACSKIAVCVALLLVFSGHGRGAAFVNLDFELARTNNVTLMISKPYLSGYGPIDELLPGWNLTFKDKMLSEVFINGLALDFGGESLVFRDAYTDDGFLFPSYFDGNYIFAVSVDTPPFILTQTGDVPADARFLGVNAIRSPGTRLEVRLNGELLENGDVSRLAGQTAELEIKMWLESQSSFGSFIAIDSLSFDTPPTLSIANDFGFAYLSWRAVPTNFVLQVSESLASQSSWQVVTNTAPLGTLEASDRQRAAVPLDGSSRFFRLSSGPGNPN